MQCRQTQRKRKRNAVAGHTVEGSCGPVAGGVHAAHRCTSDVRYAVQHAGAKQGQDAAGLCFASSHRASRAARIPTHAWRLQKRPCGRSEN